MQMNRWSTFILILLLLEIFMSLLNFTWFDRRYNGVDGLHTKVTEFEKDKDCLVCGPGILIELDTTISLKKVFVIAQLLSFPFLFLAIALSET